MTQLGAGRLHEGNSTEPVVDVLDLASVAESGPGEEREDAVAEVAGHGRALRHAGAYEAGQVSEGVGWSVAVRGVASVFGALRRAAEVDDGDLPSGAEGAERIVRERDPSVVVDVVQRQ